jgi:hypothetical protein
MAQSSQSVTLAWNPGASSGIAGYRVYYGTSSGSYPQILDVGITTTATVSNLIAGQTYYFVVTSYNAAGLESVPSNQVSFTAASGPQVPSTPGSVPKSFNGGYADLLWEYTPTDDYYIWLMQGTVHISNIYLGRVPAPWRLAGTGDFNGDGQSDLVWENTVTGQRAIWFLNHGAFVSSIYLPTVSTDWHIAGAGDFNGDGQADLVWENTITGERAIWFLNNGVPTSTISLGIVPTTWEITEP